MDGLTAIAHRWQQMQRDPLRWGWTAEQLARLMADIPRRRWAEHGLDLRRLQFVQYLRQTGRIDDDRC